MTPCMQLCAHHDNKTKQNELHLPAAQALFKTMKCCIGFINPSISTKLGFLSAFPTHMHVSSVAMLANC